MLGTNTALIEVDHAGGKLLDVIQSNGATYTVGMGYEAETGHLFIGGTLQYEAFIGNDPPIGGPGGEFRCFLYDYRPEDKSASVATFDGAGHCLAFDLTYDPVSHQIYMVGEIQGQVAFGSHSVSAIEQGAFIARMSADLVPHDAWASGSGGAEMATSVVVGPQAVVVGGTFGKTLSFGWGSITAEDEQNAFVTRF